MPDLSENGCCNSKELIKIAERSYECEFNRLVPQSVLDELDENGLSVLQVRMAFHNGEYAEHPHHRCDALIKVKGTMEPHRLLMDIHADDWNNMRNALEVDPIKEQLTAKEKGENK